MRRHCLGAMNGFAAAQCLLWLAILAVPTLPSASGQCTKQPPTVPNGAFHITSNAENAIARVYCLSTFALVGKSISICLSTGDWQTGFGTCEPRCTNSPSISNGVFAYTSDSPGSVADVLCNANYALSPSSTRLSTCVGGSWTPVIATCQALCTTQPTTISNGLVSYTSNRPGSTATLVCNSGYTLFGSSLSTCTNGQWIITGGSCQKSGSPGASNNGTCPATQTVPNGLLQITNNSRDDIAKVVCGAKYTLLGNGDSICEATGRWSFPSGTCQARCVNPPAILNGAFAYSSDIPGSIARVVCNANYTLSSSSNITSTCVDGTWSPTTAKCQARCVNPPSAPRGAFSYRSDSPGSVARILCNANYALDSLSTTMSTCVGGGWTTVSANCQARCTNQPTIANGLLSYTTNTQGSTATLVCNRGYTLAGSSSSKCDNGLWSPPTGSCEKSTCTGTGNIGICPASQTVPNGLLRITNNSLYYVAKVVCNANYTLVGNGDSTCEANSTWFIPSGTCQARCVSPPTILNGVFAYTCDSPGSNARVVCDANYTLSSSSNSTSTCTNGTWSPITALCQARCVNPPTILNGVFAYTSDSPGSNARVVCDVNYTLSSSSNSTSTCTNGTWSPITALCQAQCTTQPTTISNGLLNYTSNRQGSAATLVCSSGYTLFGSSLSTCTTGEWSNPTGTCQKSTCAGTETPPPSRSTASSPTTTAGITESKSWISNPDTIALLAVLACLGITLILVVVVVVMIRRKSAPEKDSQGSVLENSASVQPRTFGAKNMTHNKNYEETYAQPGAAAFGYSDPTGAMQRSSKRIALPPNAPLAGDPRHSTLPPGDPSDVTAYAQAGPQITKKEEAADTGYHALNFGIRSQQTARPPSTVDDAPGQEYNSLQRLKVTSSDSARLSGNNVSPRNSAVMANTDGAAQQPTANASVDYAVPEKKPKPADVSTNSLATMLAASGQTTTSGSRESTYETIPGETQKTLTSSPAGNTPGGNAGTSPKIPAAHSTVPVSATAGGVVYAIADKTGKSGKTHGSSSAAGPVEAGCGEVNAELLPGKAVYAVSAKPGKQAPTARANETQQIGEEGSTTTAVVRDSTYETIPGELADAVSGKSEQNVTSSSSSSAAALIVSDPEGDGSGGSPKATGARVSAYETVPGEEAYAIPATTNKRATAPPPPGHGYAPVGPPAVAAASKQTKSGTTSAPTYATPHKDKQAKTSSPSTIDSDAPTASDPECRGSGGPQKSATATASMYETIPGEATYATVDTTNQKATSSPPRAGGYAEIGPASGRSANRASFQPELQDGEDFPAAPTDEEVQEAETTLTASGCALNQPSANDPLLDHVVYDNGPASNTVQV